MTQALHTLTRELEHHRRDREDQRTQHAALLGRLAAGVSHEIRNPLGALVLHVDLLAEELQDLLPERPARIAQTLAEIKANLARLDDRVQDYLALMRVDHLERTPHDVGAVVQTWAREWQPLATAQRVTLRLDGVADLGQVVCHPGTLRRALFNLVQNALDALPHGGTVTLHGQRMATQVQLRVQDTNGGIPAERLTQIFEPLYTTKPGGTGLGLYIVKEVVRAHRGQVTVESQVGHGTTFTLTLPLAAVEASGPHPGPRWPA
jgi:two-component system sensor histidine kinase AtoS